MNDPDIAAGFPSPNEEEPSSLRQDILDEIRDHLQSAVHREWCLGATDEQTAWNRAIVRFGDPAAMAAKLYWHAMWRTIMRQRIMLGGIAGCLATGIGTFVLLWSMLDGQRQLVRQQQEMMQQQHQAIERLVSKLTETPKIYGSLVVTIDHPAYLKLSGGSLKDPIEFAIRNWNSAEKTHDVDFGELSPAVYALNISSGARTYEQQIVIKSGFDRRDVIEVDPHDECEVVCTTNLSPGVVDPIPVSVTYQNRNIAGRDWEARRYSLTSTIGGPDRISSFQLENSGPVTLNVVFNRRDLEFTSLSADVPGEIILTQRLDLKPGRNICQLEFPSELKSSLDAFSSIQWNTYIDEILTVVDQKSKLQTSIGPLPIRIMNLVERTPVCVNSFLN